MNLSKKKFKIILFIIIFFLVFYFLLVFILKNKNKTTSLKNDAIAHEQLKVNSGLPIRLKIPSIKVDAIVNYVGLAPDGSMDVPKGPSDVAWFDLGPRPGDTGSSVIDGHSGWKNGIPAVFDNLKKLQIGDKLYIQDEKGIFISFVVREFRNYDPKADATDVFTSNDGKSHLNLITCGGVWNEFSRTHSNRLVVFTDKETD